MRTLQLVRKVLLLPDRDRARRDCEDCGTARLSSSPPSSLRRLRLMGE
jgi:hypothetical protein